MDEKFRLGNEYRQSVYSAGNNVYIMGDSRKARSGQLWGKRIEIEEAVEIALPSPKTKTGISEQSTFFHLEETGAASAVWIQELDSPYRRSIHCSVSTHHQPPQWAEA